MDKEQVYVKFPLNTTLRKSRTVSGNIYGLRNFKVGDIHTFVDIGASHGVVSVAAQILFRPVRNICIEARKENFDICSALAGFFGAECYNIAFGSGKMMYGDVRENKAGLARFVDEAEGDFWFDSNEFTYSVESKTLSQIFDHFKVDITKPYVIKMDCEGCERFLLYDNGVFDIISNCLMYVAEFHFWSCDFAGVLRNRSLKPGQFANWLFSFNDSHEIRIGRSYRKFEGSRNELETLFRFGKKLHNIMLLNKNFKITSLPKL